MFFREKTSKNSRKPTLQLVENYRHGDKVRQKIILSLGVGFDIPHAQRKAVALAVEHKLLGQNPLFEEVEIEELSDRIVKKIQTRGRWGRRQDAFSSPEGLKEVEHIEEVYIDKVSHTHDRLLGSLLMTRLNYAIQSQTLIPCKTEPKITS